MMRNCIIVFLAATGACMLIQVLGPSPGLSARRDLQTLATLEHLIFALRVIMVTSAGAMLLLVHHRLRHGTAAAGSAAGVEGRHSGIVPEDDFLVWLYSDPSHAYMSRAEQRALYQEQRRGSTPAQPTDPD